MNGIFFRTLLAILCAGALPIALMLISLSWWARREMDDSKLESNERVAREVAAQIASILDNTTRELSVLASNKRLLDRSISPAERIAEMERVGEVHSSFAEIALYNRQGYLVETTTNDLSATQEVTSWFKAAAEGQATVSRPFVLPRGVDFSFSAYVPVEFPDSDVAVIKATLQYEQVNELIRGVRLRAGEQLLALDSFGNVVSSSDDSRFQRFDLKNRSNVWLPNGRHTSADEAEFRYVSLMAEANHALPGENLRLLWLTPEEYFTADHWTVVKSILVIGLIAAVPLCVLGGLLARSLNLPLMKAAAGADQVAQGKFGAELPLKGPKEISNLMAAFNTMIAKIRERTYALENANERLERNAKMKDEFLGTMSHELRTPLNAIIGFSEALQSQIYGNLSDPQLQSVTAIRDSGEQLLEMINDILDVAKLAAGELTLNYGEVQLHTVCSACVSRAREKARDKSLNLSCKIGKALTIRGDARRLEHVLDHVLDNAVKFTPESGAIHLEARRDAETDSVVIRIEDSGIGFPESELKRLFKPFTQGNSDRCRTHNGSGVGLTIVRELVALHGGEIKVESTVGQGTEVTLRLPCFPDEAAPSAGSAESGPEKSGPMRRGLDVVLVESNELSMIPIRTFLQSRRHQVRVANNAEGGAELAKTRPPDVVVIAADTPDFDLEHTTQIFGEASEREVVPIIALGPPGPMKLPDLPSGACRRFLPKPVPLPILDDAIHDCLCS
ncbi:MAG: ATP-binding protein [Verrucomicrobiota bacterium]